jgi:hypothetical protein
MFDIFARTFRTATLTDTGMSDFRPVRRRWGGRRRGGRIHRPH